MLVPPDPDELIAMRQRWVTERLVHRVAVVALYVVILVNLVAAVLVTIEYSLPQAASFAWMSLLVGLPTAGLFASVWRAGKTSRSALAAVRKELGLSGVSVARMLWPVLLIAIPFALSPRSADNTTLAILLVALGAIGAIVRRRNDPSMPLWGQIFVGSWIALGGVWVVALVPAFGAFAALQIGVAWISLAPFGMPLLLARNLVVRLAERGDRLGKLAKLWAIFLPPAQAARVRRIEGAPSEALALLQSKLALSLRGATLGEALTETGEALLDLGDPRAVGLFSAAARVIPGDPRPFVGLARSLRSSSPERALAYARFAESNAERRIASVDPSVPALRREIEAEVARGSAPPVGG